MRPMSDIQSQKSAAQSQIQMIQICLQGSLAVCLLRIMCRHSFAPPRTLRAWTLGLLCAVIFPGLNEFMSLRWPSISISNVSNTYHLHSWRDDNSWQLVAILLAYPAGKIWARVVPDKTIFGIELNPGHFTIKEHVVVAVMASVGGRTPAYAVSLSTIPSTPLSTYAY